MEQTEKVKSCTSSEDGGLARNRSFKSKQLVRSQAIRESTSPPRTISPYAKEMDISTDDISAIETENSDTSSHSDRRSVIHNNDRLNDKRQPVEIQITSGACESAAEAGSDQRVRAQRWLAHRPHSDSARDLLSHEPRLVCVCGNCACPNCSGKRRKQPCPSKQDSGIGCSDDCPDCSSSDIGTNASGKKSDSFDRDDQAFYCRCPERREKPKSYSVSGGDFESEPSIPELVSFIKETLNKSGRDRANLLRIERDLAALVADPGRCVARFPIMTSYGRMLVHRCAALFSLAHHLDHSAKSCVLVSKTGTSGGRLPCTRFREWCTVVFPPPPPHPPHPPHPHPHPHDAHDTLAKCILKRACESGEGGTVGWAGGPGGWPGGWAGGAPRSKSLEQRERDYERVRRRIFSSDQCAQEEAQWPWLSAPVRLLAPAAAPAAARHQLLKVQSLERDGGGGGGGRGGGGGGRGAVSKSHSFGGYCTEPAPRLLSRHGDLAASGWRLSPSSSGYKTLSLRSTDSVTPSPTGAASPEPGVAGPGVAAELEVAAGLEVATGLEVAAGLEAATGLEVAAGPGKTVGPGVAVGSGACLWAVTDMSAVPRGALVIHPQTGRPLTNPDGSLYHFDPRNPPRMQHFKMDFDMNNEKRRGKLEKQHSFIDNECECQPAPECHPRCCCECRRHDGVDTSVIEKSSPQKSKVASIQNCPNESHYQTQPVNPEQEPEPAPEPTINKETTIYEPQKPQQIPEARAQDIKYEANEHIAHHRFESPTQSPPEKPQNRRFDNPKPYEPSHQRSFEPNQRFENHSYEPNQKLFEPSNNRSFEQRGEVKEDAGHYVQACRSEEVMSPQGVVGYHQTQEMLEQQMLAQANAAPVPLPDPNIRPMPLTNMMYPAPMPPNTFPYVNACRIEPPMGAPLYPLTAEEHKPLPPSPHADNTPFRIDPSYPYAADYPAACGACDPAAAHATRGYNMPFNQTEVAGAPPYPVPNLLLPHPAHHYPYQEQVPVPVPMPVPWQGGVSKLVPEMCPVVYPTLYPYTQLYPHLSGQVVQQPYPIVQPIYPVVDKQADTRRYPPRPIRNPSRQYDEHKMADEHKMSDDNTDIQTKIQQIKEQMSQLNTRDQGRCEWRRRNSGNGILGSYPVFNGHVMGGPSEEPQLSSAARAIVHSIRTLQANTYAARGAGGSVGGGAGGFIGGGAGGFVVSGAGGFVVGGAGGGAGAATRRRDDGRRPSCLVRQMSPGTWCRRSPGPIPPGFSPRRPQPDGRHVRRPPPDTRTYPHL